MSTSIGGAKAPDRESQADTSGDTARRFHPSRVDFTNFKPRHGPTFAHAMTKRCIRQEWSMGIEEAIEAEAQAQAICMRTKDYERAYDAFVRKEKPEFLGT